MLLTSAAAFRRLIPLSAGHITENFDDALLVQAGQKIIRPTVTTQFAVSIATPSRLDVRFVVKYCVSGAGYSVVPHCLDCNCDASMFAPGSTTTVVPTATRL